MEDKWFHDENPIDWSGKEAFSGILRMYRDLIRLRRNLHRNTGGLCGPHVHVHHVSMPKTACLRITVGAMEVPGDDVIVAVNLSIIEFSSYRIGFPRAGSWVARFNSDWEGYDPSFSNQARGTGTVIAEQCETGWDAVHGRYCRRLLQCDDFITGPITGC